MRFIILGLKKRQKKKKVGFLFVSLKWIKTKLLHKPSSVQEEGRMVGSTVTSLLAIK